MANTSNTFRDDPLRTEHRADEIGVHPRHTGGQWPGWLLPLLAVLSLLALAYWALSRRQRVEPTAPSITPQTEQYKPQIPEQQRQPEPPAQQPQAAPPPAPAPAPEPQKPEAQPAPQATEEERKAEPEAAQESEPRPERQAAATGCSASFAFPVDEQTFTSAQEEKLDQLASCLKANPSSVIELEGRAHPVAGTSDERTDALALRRAQMVERELEGRGVSASQIRAKRAAPFCTDSSADCLAKNRSVVAVPAE